MLSSRQRRKAEAVSSQEVKSSHAIVMSCRVMPVQGYVKSLVQIQELGAKERIEPALRPKSAGVFLHGGLK